jgi:site-specific recombinase XerD
MPTAAPDLYRINAVVERARARLSGPDSGLPPQIARSILEFVAEREATVGPHQVSKYLSRLPDAARRLGKEFFHPDKRTKLAFLESYRGSEGWTIKTVASCLEAYWKWLYSRRARQFPDWLHLRVPRSRLNRKSDEDVLTRDEVGRLADSTDSLRDKALIWALYETGGRIGELMSLRLCDVELQPEGYIRLRVRREKNGQLSPMFLFEAGVPSMVAWTKAHPSRADQNSALWVDTNKEWGSAIGYRAVTKMLQVAAHRSGVTKPVNPHNFRHTRATELAKDPTISAAMLEKAMGWVPGSRMAETYQHLAAKDLEDALRRAHGITVPAESRQPARMHSPKACGRCGTFNEFDDRFCGRCGGPLDVETVLATETLKGKVEALAKLLEVPEVQQFLARKAAQKGILRT